MINLIKFNKEYYEPIKNGLKTQTIRKHNKRFRVNEKVKAVFSGTDKELLIQVTDTGYKQFKFINEDDAKREGYENINDLKNALLDIYPLLDNMTRIYYIRFKVIME